MIIRVASMPSIPGIRMSITTTSGLGVAGQLDRFGAGPGLADDLEVRGAGDEHAQPGAHQRLVVGEHDPDGHRAAAGSGSLRGDPETAAGPRPGGELAAEQACPLAHAGDAVPGGRDVPRRGRRR